MKAADKKRNLSDMTLKEMDKLWDEAKKRKASNKKNRRKVGTGLFTAINFRFVKTE